MNYLKTFILYLVFTPAWALAQDIEIDEDSFEGVWPLVVGKASIGCEKEKTILHVCGRDYQLYPPFGEEHHKADEIVAPTGKMSELDLGDGRILLSEEKYELQELMFYSLIQCEKVGKPVAIEASMTAPSVTIIGGPFRGGCEGESVKRAMEEFGSLESENGSWQVRCEPPDTVLERIEKALFGWIEGLI